MNRVAACTGPSLVLGGDLSRQLVISPDLQALVCQAGLPVELHFDLFARHLEGADWARLDVPVRHRAVRVESVHGTMSGPDSMLHSLPGHLGPQSVSVMFSWHRNCYHNLLCHPGAVLALAHGT